MMKSNGKVDPWDYIEVDALDIGKVSRVWNSGTTTLVRTSWAFIKLLRWRMKKTAFVVRLLDCSYRSRNSTGSIASRKWCWLIPMENQMTNSTSFTMKTNVLVLLNLLLVPAQLWWMMNYNPNRNIEPSLTDVMIHKNSLVFIAPHDNRLVSATQLWLDDVSCTWPIMFKSWSILKDL